MHEPLAYLLKWHTYGTWLHGDERGSVDRVRNVPETPLVEPDPSRMRIAARRMRHPSITLSGPARRVVARAIEDHCRIRGWPLHAQSVRSNHVHAVVEHAGLPPERMMAEFKAWATRRLRGAGLVGPDARLWVDHGSTRYLWKPRSVADAIRYVEEAQDVPR